MSNHALRNGSKNNLSASIINNYDTSIIIGRNSNTYDQGTITFGHNSTTYGERAIAIGDEAKSYNSRSIAFGQNAAVLGQQAYALELSIPYIRC